MKPELTLMATVVIFVMLLMVGCLGSARAHTMRDCVEHMPFILTPNEPEHDVLKGLERDQTADEEDDSDVDHCYDPTGNPDEVYDTSRAGQVRLPRNRAKVFKPLATAA